MAEIMLHMCNDRHMRRDSEHADAPMAALGVAVTVTASISKIVTCHHGLPHSWPVHVGKEDEDDEAEHMEPMEDLQRHQDPGFSVNDKHWHHE